MRFAPIALVALALVLGGCSAQDDSQAHKDANAASHDASQAGDQLRNAAGQAESAIDKAASSQQAHDFKQQLLAIAIKSRLASSDLDAASNVRVSVANGVATLSGRVHTAGEKAKLVGETGQIGGVKSVDDQLVIDRKAPNASESLDDVGLEAKVRTALVGQAGTNGFRVSVKAHDGHVTLGGTVPSADIKSTIVATAKNTAGVRSLSETIAVHS
jgi:osmotically-inducible protein OsmY